MTYRSWILGWLIITYSFTPGAALHAQELRPTLEIRAGSADDPLMSFGRIVALTVDSTSGRIFVADGSDQMIKILDREGRYVGRLGGSGNGPGEFRSIQRLGWRGDTLWVTDSSTRRITMFTARGELHRSLTLPSLDAWSRFGGVYPLGLGSGDTVVATMSGAIARIADGRLTEIPIVAVDPMGSARQLGSIEVRQDLTTLTDGRRNIVLRQPVTDRSLHAVSKDGTEVVIVHRRLAQRVGTHQFSVTRIRASGDTVFSVQMPYTPTALSRAMRDSIVEERVASMAPDEAVYWEGIFRRALRFPAFLPGVEEVFVALDGTTWVQLGGSPGPERRWIVFDERGDVRARVLVPSSFSAMEAHLAQRWLLGVERGLFDVPYVTKYRLNPL